MGVGKVTGWVPIVSDIVESSLWREEDYVVKVFLSMLAKKDSQFFCRGDLYTVANWANKLDSIEEVVEALRVLESPDTKKPLVKQEFDGRRIEKVEGGWKILNGEKYRKLVAEFKEQKRKREWARDNQEKKRKHKTSGCTAAERHYLDGVKAGTIDAETGGVIEEGGGEGGEVKL